MTEPSQAPSVFVLDDGREPGFVPVLDVGSRWMELPFAANRSRGFVLLPGEGLAIPEFIIDRDHRLYLEAMRVIEEASPDGMELEAALEVDGSEWFLGEIHLGSEQVYGEPVRFQVDLSAYAGQRAKLLLRCKPGRGSDPIGDWCAIITCVVASSDCISLAVATSQFAWRIANETTAFTDVYSNDIYQDSDDGSGGGPPVPINATRLRPAEPRLLVDACEVLRRLKETVPMPDETAFGLANRLLGVLMPRPPIDFAGRLRMIADSGSKPRILSLCAGEARIECQVLREADVAASITLLDLNGTMLQRAVARMPPGVEVRLWQGSVDALAGVDDEFDVACFVSGLHHVSSLELVLSQVARLVPSGEMWIIGEQVGRNGNRLWPDAQRKANQLFRALPERLRANRSTGKIDSGLPDVNYASSCFEGIRSEEIHRVLARNFRPILEEFRNCFLWRLIEPAYEANYDLANPGDVDTLQRLVAEEYAFFANGGLGCELNGVYRNKLAAGW